MILELRYDSTERFVIEVDFVVNEAEHDLFANPAPARAGPPRAEVACGAGGAVSVALDAERLRPKPFKVSQDGIDGLVLCSVIERQMANDACPLLVAAGRFLWHAAFAPVSPGAVMLLNANTAPSLYEARQVLERATRLDEARVTP